VPISDGSHGGLPYFLDENLNRLKFIIENRVSSITS